MRIFKIMLSKPYGGKSFFSCTVLSRSSLITLYISIFFLASCISDLCIGAEQHPAAPGKNFRLVWEDNFSGSSIDTSYWNVYSKNKGWGFEKYRPSQVTVANSICTFTAVKEGNDYWSGGLTNNGKKGVISYGYYEMRCKLPRFTSGQWPAFWLVGCNGNWMPEFDIVDGTNWGNDCFFTNPHWRDSTGAHKQSGFNACPERGNITSDFHTYGFLWTKDSCIWYFDDKKIRFWKTDSIIPDCPNPIILNFEMGGWGGKTIADSTLPWVMQIDWVRVWKIDPTATSYSTNSLKQHIGQMIFNQTLSISQQENYKIPWLASIELVRPTLAIVEPRYWTRNSSGRKLNRLFQLPAGSNIASDRIILRVS